MSVPAPEAEPATPGDSAPPTPSPTDRLTRLQRRVSFMRAIGAIDKDAPAPLTEALLESAVGAASADAVDDDADETGSNAWHTEEDSEDEATAVAVRDLAQRVASVSVEKQRLQTQLEKTEQMQAQLVEALRSTQDMLHRLHDQYQRQTESNERLINQVGKDAFSSRKDYDKFIMSSLTEHEDTEIHTQYSALVGNIDELLHNVTAGGAGGSSAGAIVSAAPSWLAATTAGPTAAAAAASTAPPAGTAADAPTDDALGSPGVDVRSYQEHVHRKYSSDLTARAGSHSSLPVVAVYTEADVAVPPLWSPHTFSRQVFVPSMHRVDCLLPNQPRFTPPG